MVRKGTDLESSIVYVERVKEYSETARQVYKHFLKAAIYAHCCIQSVQNEK